MKPCGEQIKTPKELTQDVNDPEKVVLLHDFGLLPTPYYRAVGTDQPPHPPRFGQIRGNLILSGGRGGADYDHPSTLHPHPPGFSDIPTARLLKAAHLHMRIHRDTR